MTVLQSLRRQYPDQVRNNIPGYHLSQKYIWHPIESPKLRLFSVKGKVLAEFVFENKISLKNSYISFCCKCKITGFCINKKTGKNESYFKTSINTDFINKSIINCSKYGN